MSPKHTTDRYNYFQSIDAAMATIRDRFDQAEYSLYAKLEQVLLLAAVGFL